MMFLVIVLLVFGGYYLFRQSGNIRTKHNGVSDAEELLKQRFISGEIDEDTYTRMLKTIRT